MKSTHKITIPGILLGTTVMVIISTLLVLLLPLLVANGMLPQKYISLAGLLIHGISVLIGALLAANATVGSKAIIITECAAIYYLLYICIGMLFYQGISLYALYTAIVCTVASLTAFLVLKKGNKKTKRKSKIHTHR